MNQILNIILLALAVHQTVNIVRYSALFAWLRDRIETGQKVLNFLPRPVSDFASQVVECPWCLSVHAAWFYLVGVLAPDWLLFPAAIRFLMWTAAISQLSNLLHFYTKHRGIKQ